MASAITIFMLVVAVVVIYIVNQKKKGVTK